MATITVILQQDRQKKDGTFPIAIRVTNQNKSKYRGVGFSVKSDQFKEGAADWVRRHPDALFINSIAEDMRAKMMAKVTRLRLDGRPFDFDFIMSDAPADGHTMGEILGIIADTHEKNKKIVLEARHRSLKREVIDCLGTDPVLNHMNIDNAKKILGYFGTVRGNNKNTSSRKFRFLRAAFNEAIAMWENIGKNPFELVKAKGQPVRRIKLKEHQIVEIENLQLVGFIDVCRDAYLFSYYSQGMRFEKVMFMEKSQIDETHIHYRMNKGLHNRELETHPKLRKIIEKYRNSDGPYLFPIIKKVPKDEVQYVRIKDEANVMVNTALKRIAILSGIDGKVTFHTAKHSYAQMAKRKGVNPWIIKDSLGHTNFKTTEDYLNSLDDDEINAAVSGLF